MDRAKFKTPDAACQPKSFSAPSKARSKKRLVSSNRPSASMSLPGSSGLGPHKKAKAFAPAPAAVFKNAA